MREPFIYKHRKGIIGIVIFFIVIILGLLVATTYIKQQEQKNVDSYDQGAQSQDDVQSKVYSGVQGNQNNQKLKDLSKEEKDVDPKVKENAFRFAQMFDAQDVEGLKGILPEEIVFHFEEYFQHVTETMHDVHLEILSFYQVEEYVLATGVVCEKTMNATGELEYDYTNEYEITITLYPNSDRVVPYGMVGDLHMDPYKVYGLPTGEEEK